MTNVATTQVYEEDYWTLGKDGGYTNRGRSLVSYADDPEDQGEQFRTQHWKFYQRYSSILEGKKVLEIACAEGFLTEDLRSWGVECYGIDKNDYSRTVSTANAFCQKQDARTYLATLPNNAFDTIVACRFLPCLTDAELVVVIPEILRVAPKRFFLIDDTASYDRYAIGTLERAQQFYNVKTLAEWAALLPGCFIESAADPKWMI